MSARCCSMPRPEAYEVQAPRNGVARIDRCLECGAHRRTWICEPAPPPKVGDVVVPLEPWERDPWPEFPR